MLRRPAPSATPSPPSPNPKLNLGARIRILRIAESIRRQLCAGKRNVRIRIPLVRAIEHASRHTITELRARERLDDRNARPLIVAPDLDVLEQRDVFLGHD